MEYEGSLPHSPERTTCTHPKHTLLLPHHSLYHLSNHVCFSSVTSFLDNFWPNILYVSNLRRYVMQHTSRPSSLNPLYRNKWAVQHAAPYISTLSIMYTEKEERKEGQKKNFVHPRLLRNWTTKG